MLLLRFSAAAEKTDLSISKKSSQELVLCKLTKDSSLSAAKKKNKQKLETGFVLVCSGTVHLKLKQKPYSHFMVNRWFYQIRQD